MGDEVKDKLMMKHERYFFKEGKEMDKLKDAEKLVDLAFDESFEIFGKVVKAEKQISKILDALDEKQDEVDLGQGSSIQMRPYDHPKKVRPVVDVDECGMMGGGMMNKGISNMDDEPEEDYEDYESTPDDDETNTISHVPNQHARSLYKSIISQLGEINSLSEDKKAAYKKYFDGMLKKFGVTSPAQLDDAKKKAFFNAVDKGWKGVKESFVEEGILDKRRCEGAKIALKDEMVRLKRDVKDYTGCMKAKKDAKFCDKFKKQAEKTKNIIKKHQDNIKKYCK